MSDRSVTERRADEAFKATLRGFEDRLTALESRRTQGDIQLKSLVVNEGLQVSDAGGIVGVIAPIVSALPPEPYYGQTVRYLIPSSLRLWTLVYGGSDLDPWPWLFAGGEALMSVVAANESDATAPLNDLATPGPTITIPLDGVYDLSGGYYVNTSTAASVQTAQTLWSPTGGYPGFAVISSNPGAANATLLTVAAAMPDTVLTGAPGTLKMQYSTSGTASYSQRWLRAAPVRVGA